MALRINVLIHPCSDTQSLLSIWTSRKVFHVSPEDSVGDLCDKVTEYTRKISSEDFYISFVFRVVKGQPLNILPFHEKISVHLANEADVDLICEHKPAINYLSDSMKSEKTAKIPITILTGFLGAGKTTLLNHLLREQKEERIAVIENEFGEIAIDKELLPDEESKISSAEQVVVMDNGCMCCTVRGDLLAAFRSICEKINEGNKIDSVLIETTGLANPVPIARTIRNTPFISHHYELNGVLTLVDAKNIKARLEKFKLLKESEISSNEAFQQIMFADKVVISKIDLIDGIELLDIRDEIKCINLSAPIIGCSMGQLDPKEARNLRAKGDEELFGHDLVEASHQQYHSHSHSHGHDSQHSHTECNDVNCKTDSSEDGHIKGIKSFSISKKNVSIDPFIFAWWVRKLATSKKDMDGELYRAKGILSVSGSSQDLIFHAVQDVMDKHMVKRKSSTGDECKVVFIGKNLNEAYFRQTLEPHFLSDALRKSIITGATACDCFSFLHQSCNMMFYRILLFFDSSADVCRLGLSCRGLFELVFGDDAMQNCKSLLTENKNVSVVHHRSNRYTNLHCHGLSMGSIKTYWNSMMQAELDIISLKGIDIPNAEHAEACAITWLEVCNLAESETRNYVVDFKWRSTTLDTFFSNPNVGITSALARIEYEIEDEVGDQDFDTIKFKLKLQPVNSNEDDGLEMYKLVIQIIGGRSASQVYLLSFHSIHYEYQFHIKVDDHRIPIYETKETFHRYHPVLDALRKEERIRTLIRVKPDGSGPLGDMCGCC